MSESARDWRTVGAVGVVAIGAAAVIGLVSVEGESTERWTWDASPTADGYRVYWSDERFKWCSDRLLYDGPDPEADVVFPDPPGGGLHYLVVTGYDSAGEGPTEHGTLDYPGVCP